jgi:Fe2+ or Zn2+ uptake regulation protein
MNPNKAELRTKILEYLLAATEPVNVHDLTDAVGDYFDACDVLQRLTKYRIIRVLEKKQGLVSLIDLRIRGTVEDLCAFDEMIHQTVVNAEAAREEARRVRGALSKIHELSKGA